MLVRLQKHLADCQIASRRKAEELITAGRVTVNGAAVTELGTKIDTERDEVCFDGKLIKLFEKKFYIMLHKPEGYITSVKDQFGRPTVLDLVGGIDARLFPVGRLDYDTSGLLLLTNDGVLTYRLTHPKHDIEKVYVARVKGTPSAESLKTFETGITMDGHKTAPARIKIVKEWNSETGLKIAIKEGRNRQVRKMLKAIGHETISLKRVATGNLFLGKLPKGEYRPLTADEVKYLFSLESIR